jgi:hypothetical protein
LQLDCDSPLRQWVLSLPYALRFLLATDPDSLTRVLRTGYHAISGLLIQEGGPYACHRLPRRGDADPALRLSTEPEHIHFHMIFLDGCAVV